MLYVIVAVRRLDRCHLVERQAGAGNDRCERIKSFERSVTECFYVNSS